MDTTVPLWVEPTSNTLSNVSHGFSWSCLWPRLMRRLALSSSSTTTSISSPTLQNSEGCLIFLSQLRSEMWTRPSMPSSISTNRPKLVKLRTFPECLDCTGNLNSMLSHGSGTSCFMPRLIFRSSRSMPNTTVSISSPTFRNSWALRRCWLQLISLTWSRPSTPSDTSTKAP